MTANKIPALYVHVPFCASICSYCDFSRQVYRAETADRWLAAIEAELKARADGIRPETIYIGGGTPSCLPLPQLERLLSMLDPYAETVKEYTVECNPELRDKRVIECLASHRVNRISIGLQTADSSLLKTCGRRHDAADVKRLVDQFLACGISNISLDLMYGLPDQTMEQLEQSIAFALSCHPRHLSLYSLTIEPNSVFGKKGIQPADPDLEADMYERICSILKAHGYLHYEISNFALPGYESKHNTSTWEYRDFLGIGYGAWGMEDHYRYTHADTLRAYLEDPLYRNVTELTEKERMFEAVMMGLRLRSGISSKRFYDQFGIHLNACYPNTISALKARGLLAESDDRLFCTEQGWPVLNSLLVEFMEEAQL